MDSITSWLRKCPFLKTASETPSKCSVSGSLMASSPSCPCPGSLLHSNVKSLGHSLFFPRPCPFCLAFPSATLFSVLQWSMCFSSWLYLYALQCKGPPDKSKDRSALYPVPAAIAFPLVTTYCESSWWVPSPCCSASAAQQSHLGALKNTTTQASSLTNQIKVLGGVCESVIRI